ncbi:SWIM zinc finger family protein [Hyphococcus sp.]|uniref:SWIM zinc finger family protein n=1 Tax=Hyphococcus sp. TaxID=2038636 RepID=UPI002086414F|nr:MAG: hypothetical protein DHS20C04_14780 [Marinicaulis sp.]
MKQALQFSIMGEDDETYIVSIERDAVDLGNLTALCSCDSAQLGDLCHHRFAVLEGETMNLVSESVDDVVTLRQWIKGSDIEVAMQNLSKAKTEMKLAHEKVEQCRRMLVKRMLD